MDVTTAVVPVPVVTVAGGLGWAVPVEAPASRVWPHMISVSRLLRAWPAVLAAPKLVSTSGAPRTT